VILRLLIFLFAAVGLHAQTINQASSLTNLLTRTPVVNGLYLVSGYKSDGDWGAPRLAQHISGSTLTTNTGNVFTFGSGRLVFGDRTNAVQDARWWNLPIDGTTDSRPSIQSAINAAVLAGGGRGEVFLPPRTFKIYGSLTNSGVRINGNGATVVPDGTNYTFIASGSLGSYASLDTDAIRGTNIIYSTVLASTLTKGDQLKLMSSADFSSGGDTGRPQGEQAIVDRTSGSAIYLLGPIQDTYTVANTGQVARVTPTWFAFSPGLKITAPDYHVTTAPTPRGVFAQYVNGASVEGLTVSADEAAMFLLDDYGSTVSGMKVTRANYSGGANGYGLFVGNASMFTTVRDCIFDGARNPTDLGGNSLGGVAWGIRFVNCVGSSSYLSAQDVYASHASVGSVDYVRCLARGTALSQRGFSGHGRRVRVLDCETDGLAYGVYAASYTDSRELLEVDGLRMRNPIGSGYGVTVANVTVTNLVVKRTEGSLGSAAVIISTGSTVQNWAFDSLNNDSGGAILIASGVTVPTDLYVPSSVLSVPSMSSTIYGIQTAVSNVVRVSGVGLRGSNLAGLVSVSALAPSPTLECVGCSSTASYGAPFVFNSTATSARIVGGSFRGIQTPTALVSASTISDVVSIGNDVDATVTSWASGAATNVVRIGNKTAAAVTDAGTLAGSYWMALPSSGAVPFALTIDTTSADNLTSVRAIASGKARLYVGGRSTSTGPTAFGVGGGDITLQNVNTTPNNFVQIATLDGAGGDMGHNITFRFDNHTNNLGSISFYTRSGSLIEAVRMQTNGVLQAKVGIETIAATNVIAYVSGTTADATSTARAVVNHAISSLGRELIAAGSQSAARTSLGLGTIATLDDAPSDGFGYVRSNAAWAKQSGGGAAFNGFGVYSDSTGQSVGITNINLVAGSQITLSHTDFEPLVYVAATLHTTTLASFKAQDGEPPASNYATFSTRNGIGVMLFDPTVEESMRYRFLMPKGWTQTNATVVLTWTTTANTDTARWGVKFMRMTGDIDSDSFGTATEASHNPASASGTIYQTTLSGVDLDGTVSGEWAWLSVYRDVSDAADTVSVDLELHGVEVRAE
jgi:hypothetical protein